MITQVPKVPSAEPSLQARKQPLLHRCLAHAAPKVPAVPTQRSVFLGDGTRPLQDAVVGQIARTLWILLASVGLVLLVACANVANLFLVRSDARRREVAVRQALGAGSRALAGYFLAESVLLSLAGSVIGLGLSLGAVRLLVAFAPAERSPLHSAVGMHPRRYY